MSIRTLLASLLLGVVLASGAWAQEPAVWDTARGSRAPVTAEQLIRERAALRARQRAARLQSRRDRGLSAHRPSVTSQPVLYQLSIDPWADWYAYGAPYPRPLHAW